MSLLQRIATPFGEPEPDDPAPTTMPNAAGELLRERRTQLRLDLDAVAEALCIKPVYLAAIEQGRNEELPGPAYAIGFIRAYANYLGLDGERVLDLYREEMAEAQTRPDLALPVPLEERSVPGARLLLTGLVLALCGYGTWYYVGTGERERPERVAAVPAELQHLIAPVPGEAPVPGTAAGTAAALPPAAPQATMPAKAAAAPQFGSGLRTAQPQTVSTAAVAPDSMPSIPALSIPVPAAASASGGVAEPAAPAASIPGATGESTAASPPATPSTASSGSVDIRALADSWVQIRDADQGIVFARVLKAGETYRVPRSGLILRTGNAGALEVLVDGKPAPELGAPGTLRRDVRLEPDALRAGTAVRG